MENLKEKFYSGFLLMLYFHIKLLGILLLVSSNLTIAFYYLILFSELIYANIRLIFCNL